MSTTPEPLAVQPPAAAGWIVTMPDGHPYLWYQQGWKGCTDSATVMSVFESDPEARSVLISEGWSARPGNPGDLYTHLNHERISA